MTGTAATFRVNSRLSAASGSHVVTGTEALLIRHQSATISAASGGVIVTGTAAVLRSGRRVTAATATYAVTGTAATFLVDVLSDRPRLVTIAAGADRRVGIRPTDARSVAVAAPLSRTLEMPYTTRRVGVLPTTARTVTIQEVT